MYCITTLMLYYHCCCCQMAMTGSSLCPSFLHRITNARSFTVVHLLMMVVIVICICINIYIGTIRSSFPSRIITTLSFQAVMYISVVVMDEIYIYIYIYIWVYFVCDTILYDGVVLVRMTWYRLFTLSIVCWVSPYLQRIMTTRSFTVVVHLLVVVLIVDWYMYMHILVQLVDTTHVAFLSCMYI